MGKDLATDDIEISEYGKQIAGQLTLNDVQEESDTSERIADTQPGKVRNL
jgi:hypothetical protein